jgi:signal transduction histidine kinase
VMLTAHDDKELVIVALDAGASDFMTKPFDRGELLARLRAGERTVKLHDEAAQAARLQSERNHLSDAMRAMEQVLAVVAHELHTPIAALEIMTEYLVNPAARKTEEWERFLKQTRVGVRQMGQIVNDLLEAARLNSGVANWNWTRIGLRELCNSGVEQIRPMLMSRPVEVRARVDPEDAWMSGDAAAVLRLLVNFLNNSIKYTQSGAISVEASGFEQDGERWIKLSVTDTGEGMTPEILARLGQAFMLNRGVVGTNHVSGLGLGIAISKRIAEAHGGRITISSALGEGTCATAFLRADLAEPIALETGGIFVARGAGEPAIAALAESGGVRQ